MNSPTFAVEPQTAPEPEARLVAPHRLRAAAGLIDLAIIGLVIVAVPPGDHLFLFVLGVFIAYHTVLIWLMQQTVGKGLFGLRVERSGKKPKFVWALARASLGYCAVDLFGVGILAALFNHDHRCFHDYVFGTRVFFQGPEKVKIRVLLNRLIEFAKKQNAAEGAKTVAILGGLWTFLEKIGTGVRWLMDWILGLKKNVSIKAAVGVTSTKAAVVVGAVATAVTVSASYYVPPVRQFADLLLTPHVIKHPPEDWGKCTCPDKHLYIGVIYNGERWHSAGYSCPND
jgi:uncharacterized RDD family membrane protein YckC